MSRKGTQVGQYFWTADEHYGHKRIIEYCNRPWIDVNDMDEEIIKRHNEVVKKIDTVIHVGDFTLTKKDVAEKYIKRLNGRHWFLRGSHDYWLKKGTMTRWERKVQGQYIVADHYAMRVWARSHYNSWQVHGHSHGGLEPSGKQHDVGVDNNNFYPVSFDQLVEIMKNRPDNFNLVKKDRRR